MSAFQRLTRNCEFEKNSVKVLKQFLQYIFVLVSMKAESLLLQPYNFTIKLEYNFRVDVFTVKKNHD